MPINVDDLKATNAPPHENPSQICDGEAPLQTSANINHDGRGAPVEP